MPRLSGFLFTQNEARVVLELPDLSLDELKKSFSGRAMLFGKSITKILVTTDPYQLGK